jgi:hypothetical protein
MEWVISNLVACADLQVFIVTRAPRGFCDSKTA